MTISDYGKEILLFSIDAVVLALALKWYRHNHKAEQTLMGPVLDNAKDIDKWVENNPSKTCWAVIQGVVEPSGPVIHSFNDRDIQGVVQRLKIKEFVTARNTSGFWQDTERIIADSYNTVPFGLRVGGDSLVQIEQPLESSLLTLRTVSSEFTRKEFNVLDHIWSFFIGTKHRGIQTNEEMLLTGTKLTGVGVLSEEKSMNAASTLSLQPHYLSELTVGELQSHIKSQVKWSSALLFISGIAGIAIIAYSVRKFVRERKKKLEEAERRTSRFKRGRADLKKHNETSEQTCIICDNPREVILIPCGHICLCFDCSQHIDNKCPMCRAFVSTINEYFMT